MVTRSGCFMVAVYVAVILLGVHLDAVKCEQGKQNHNSKTNFIQLLQNLMSQPTHYMPGLSRGMPFGYMNQPVSGIPMHMMQGAMRQNAAPMFLPTMNMMQPLPQPPQIPQLTQQIQQPQQSEYERTQTVNNLFNSDTCGKIRPKVTNYVSGGYPIDNLDHPWYVQIIIHNVEYTESETFCGGTLITPEWVLTAAHCYDDMRPERLARATQIIFRGIHGHHRKFVAKADLVILHDEYVPALLPWEAEAQGLRPGPFNDMALVRIRVSEIPRSILQKLVPACLPAANIKVTEGTICKVMGHGFMNGNDEKNFHMPPNLQAAKVSITSNRACQDDVESRVIKEKINEKTCCVRGPIHPCVGDSGGPLLCTGRSRRHVDGSAFDENNLSDEQVLSEDYEPRKWYLVGVTSFAVSTDGHDSCGTFKSAVFGLVATQLEWIKNTVIKYTDFQVAHHGAGHHGFQVHGGQNYYN